MTTTTEAGVLAGFVLFGATVAKPGGGFCGSYDYTTFAASFDAFTAASFPALLAVESLERQKGFTTQTFQGGMPTQDYIFEHYLLGARVSDVADYSAYRATLITLRDNYIAALKANPLMTFNGDASYHTAPIVQPQIIDSEWLDTMFHTVLFRFSIGLNL